MQTITRPYTHCPRRLGKRLLCALLWALCSLSSHADETQYVTTTTLSTANKSFNSSDDAVSGSIPLGFTFRFGGTNYTTAVCSSNGVLFFGGATNAYTNQALNSMTGSPGIYPFWDDLYEGTPGNASLSQCLYYTTGTAGSRVFIMQWTNWYSYSESYEVGTWNVVLHEGTNTIDMYYRNMLGTSALRRFGASATIGIVAPGNYVSQYSLNTASITEGKLLTYTPSAGGASPYSLQDRNFTPATAASLQTYFLTTSASPKTPISLSASPANPNATSATLSWSLSTQGATPTSYVIRYANNAQFTGFTQTASFTTPGTRILTGLTAGTTYYWEVVAIASTIESASTASSFLQFANRAPVAANGSLSTPYGTAASGSMTATDVDNTPNTSGLTYSISTSPTSGSILITNAATGAYTYTPNANFTGADSFTFRAYDGTAFSATATISITVAAPTYLIAVEQPTGMALAFSPPATVDFGSVDLTSSTGTTKTFTIRNSGTSSLTSTGLTVGGANAADFTITASPAFPIAAGGSTTFTVRFSPTGAGTRNGSISIPSNDASHTPFVVNLTGINSTLAPTVTSSPATSLSYTVATLNGSANPSGIAVTGGFVYGTSATLTTGTTTTASQSLGSGTSPVAYSTVLTGLSPHSTYYFRAFAANLSGTGQGAILTFTTANHSPVAASDSFSAPSGSAAFTLNVKANDTDADNDPLVISAVSDGTYGTASTNGSTVTYTPGPDYQGNDTFSYIVADGFGGVSTGAVTIYRAPACVTTAATGVEPGAATFNALVTPNGLDTTLAFEYATNEAFTSSTTTTSASVGTGPGSIAGSATVTGLTPNTRYYFRAIATSAAGSSRGQALSFLSPLMVWGNAGTLPTAGKLDATVIPNTTTTPIVYSNVNGQRYDVQVTTNSLANNEFIEVLGESSWWLEGSAVGGSGPATVQIKFCATGTSEPQAVTGVRFRFEDAERYEAFSNFSYFNAAGTEIPLLWNDGVFSYSHTPVFNTGRTEVENGAPSESTVQNGKWIQANLAGIPVTGFKFGLRRKAVSAAGGVVMSSLGGASSPMDVLGTFTPITINTDSSGTAIVPDYTSQARIVGSTSATLTQTPAPGTRVPTVRISVILNATDAAGNTAHTGFNVTVIDRTVPTVAPPATGFAPLTLTLPNVLPDYTSQALTSDNGGLVKVSQSPKPGTLVSLGLLPVTLTATDAAGNTSTTTFTVTGIEDTSNTDDVHYASVVATSGPISGAGEPGSPLAKGATFQTFGVPSVGDSGVLAFTSTFAQGALRKTGIFAGSPPQLVAAKGDAAPDAEGTVFSTFYDPALNRSATVTSVAFQANLLAAPGYPALTSANNTGVWTNVGGKLALVLRSGGIAPDTQGAKFRSITAFTIVDDEVLVTAALVQDGSNTTIANDQGAWRWTPASGLRLVLREGQTLPSDAGDKVVSSFQMIGSVASSTGHGRHHLAAGRFQARVTCVDKSVVNYLIDATGDSVVYTPIGQTGKALLPGLTATTVGVPAGNVSGETAFVQTFATTKSKSVTTANNLAIVSSRGGVWDCVACKGEVACSGATWAGFSDPVINDNGDVAWISGLAGTTAALNSAVGWGPKGSEPCVVARKGWAAAGTAGGLFASFTSVALPDGGCGPLFTASLLRNTGDVTASNDTGLWAVDCHDSLRLLLRKGQAIAGKTVRSFTVLTSVLGSPGQTHSFNTQRKVLVSVTFTDNVQSLLSVTIP